MDPLTPTIRRAYRDSGLTIREISARSGVSYNTVWAVLAGRNVRTHTLFAVCRALGVSTLCIPATSESWDTAAR